MKSKQCLPPLVNSSDPKVLIVSVGVKTLQILTEALVSKNKSKLEYD